MKNILFAALFIFSTILIFSCKKGNSNSGYYITCDINGRHKSFSDSTQMDYFQTAADLEIRAYGGLSTVSSPTLKISLYNRGVALTTRSYTDTAKDCRLTAIYFPVSVYSAAFEAGDDTPTGLFPGSKNLVITITSISPSEIKGTFSGDLAHLSDTTDIAHVTNGKFNLKNNLHP